MGDLGRQWPRIVPSTLGPWGRKTLEISHPCCPCCHVYWGQWTGSTSYFASYSGFSRWRWPHHWGFPQFWVPQIIMPPTVKTSSTVDVSSRNNFWWNKFDGICLSVHRGTGPLLLGGIIFWEPPLWIVFRSLSDLAAADNKRRVDQKRVWN